MLFSACGLSLGTLVYAQTTGRTIQANTTTKAYVFVGSDVSAPVDADYDGLPSSFPFPWTVATQILGRASLSDGRDIDLIAVDSSTVARAAYWHESFADAPLGELSGRLESPVPDGLNVLTTENLADGASLEVGGVSIPVRSVAQVRAFPGMVGSRPLLVLDSDHLRDALSERGGEDVVADPSGFPQIWVKGDPSRIESELLREGFVPEYVLSAETVLHRPVLVAIMRSFTFLRALGLLSSLIVVLGLMLYLQARQRQRTLLLALAERMGLTRRAHMSALALELGVMLLIALLVGGMVGIGISALLFKRLDPLPTVAPAPTLVVSTVLALVLITALVALAIAGAYLADRAARRVSLTEVLRYE
jgi:putative ABC transport system permease protein